MRASSQVEGYGRSRPANDLISVVSSLLASCDNGVDRPTADKTEAKLIRFLGLSFISQRTDSILNVSLPAENRLSIATLGTIRQIYGFGNKLPESHRPWRNRIIHIIGVEAFPVAAYWSSYNRGLPDFGRRICCNMNFEHRSLDNADQTHEARKDLSVGSTRNKMQGPPNPSEFKKNEFVVYPAHGVGQITAIEIQTVAGSNLEFFVVYFSKSKLRARVPTHKAASIGMRKLSSPAAIEQVRRTVSQAASKARTNWARLAKEYEAKIKSGEIVALAEVIRDLHRRSTLPEQSYSERQLYATALDRLSAEIALAEGISEEKATLELVSLLMSRTGRAAV